MDGSRRVDAGWDGALGVPDSFGPGPGRGVGLAGAGGGRLETLARTLAILAMGVAAQPDRVELDLLEQDMFGVQ
jgi:hypothetical protein